MKKIFLLLIVIGHSCLYSFDEYKFMKSVNNKLSIRDMRIIKQAVDNNYKTVSHFMDKEHVYMLIANESHFKQFSKLSDIGGLNKGLMQIQFDTYMYMCKKYDNLKCQWRIIDNIPHNIKVGMYVLLDKYNKIQKMFTPSTDKKALLQTLIAYNKGEHMLRRDIEDGRYDFHNYIYIKSVFRFKKYLKNKYL